MIELREVLMTMRDHWIVLVAYFIFPFQAVIPDYGYNLDLGSLSRENPCLGSERILRTPSPGPTRWSI